MKFTRQDVEFLRYIQDENPGYHSDAKALADKIESTFKPVKPASDLKFVHLRNAYIDAFGVTQYEPAVSIGYTKPFQGKVFVAVARQNPNDNFNKKIARKIIEGRIKSGDAYDIEVDTNDVPSSVITWAINKGYWRA